MLIEMQFQNDARYLWLITRGRSVRVAGDTAIIILLYQPSNTAELRGQHHLAHASLTRARSRSDAY